MATQSGRNSGAPSIPPDAAAALRPPVVEMRHISKQFGPVAANRDVSVNLYEGEVHALLGENGAGKTTLMSILSGMYQPDAGELLIDGGVTRISSPSDALSRGIGAVYQHFTLVSNLSIVENIALGAPGGLLLDLQGTESRVASMLREFGLTAPPRTLVEDLSIGERQRVEIVKVLSRGTRVLLLDEPTSVLTPTEVEGLLELVRGLKARGVAVVIVTHKLDEALAVCDRITVLRGGRKVAELGPVELASQSRTSTKQLVVEAMFGRGTRADRIVRRSSRPPGDVLLSMDRVSAQGSHNTIALKDISLELRAGEIFGIAGVDGNGQKELGEVIAGQRHSSSGRVRFEDQDMTNVGVAQSTAMGIGYVTDERLHEGSVASASVAENSVLKTVRRLPFSRGLLLDRSAITAHARDLIQAFDVRTPGPDVPIGLLSGGNIQKLLLARELSGNPRVLVCNKPTHGLDVRTAQFVSETLRRHADAGNAVLLISSELDEILDLSDRIGVMYGGELAAVFPGEGANPEEIGRVMLDGKAAAEEAVA